MDLSSKRFTYKQREKGFWRRAERRYISGNRQINQGYERGDELPLVREAFKEWFVAFATSKGSSRQVQRQRIEKNPWGQRIPCLPKLLMGLCPC